MAKLFITRFGNIVSNDFGCPSIQDVAHTLASINRYNGSAVKPMNVAAHSILCEMLGALEQIPIRLHCLLHDAAESIIGDIPSQFKTKENAVLEEKMLARIYQSIGVPEPTPEEKATVKEFDRQSLRLEVHELGISNNSTKYLVERPTLKLPAAFAQMMERPDFRWAEEYEYRLITTLRDFHDRETF